MKHKPDGVDWKKLHATEASRRAAVRRGVEKLKLAEKYADREAVIHEGEKYHPAPILNNAKTHDPYFATDVGFPAERGHDLYGLHVERGYDLEGYDEAQRREILAYEQS